MKFNVDEWIETIKEEEKIIGKVYADNYILIDGIGTPIEVDFEEYKKWIPEEDQYHWFFSKDDDEPVFGKLKYIMYKNSDKKEITGYHCSMSREQWCGMGTITSNVYESCAPFIGVLPNKLFKNKYV